MRTALLVLSLLWWAGCDTNEPALIGPQQPPISGEVVFGTENYDAGLALLLASDGGLLVAGAANGVVAPADGTLPTPGLSRLAGSAVRWTRIYDALAYGSARAVVEDDGGGAVLLVERHDLSFRDWSVALWRVDAEGRLLNALHERPGGTTYFSATRPLLRLPDGGYVLVGNDRTDAGPDPAFVLRLDAGGTPVWEQILPLQMEPTAVAEAADGGFVVLGSGPVAGPAFDEVMYLVRLDADGAVRWTRAYGEPDRVERSAALIALPDGGFLATGMQSGDDGFLPYVLRLGPDSTPAWTRTYADDPNLQRAHTQGLAATPDGGFAFTGWSRTRADRIEAFVLKLSATGDRRWTRLFGADAEVIQGYDLLALTDGRLVVTGARGPDIPSFGGADYDVFVLTLDADGRPAP